MRSTGRPGGPLWDALGVADENGAVLVGAKSYPREFYSGRCKAKARQSLERIIEAVGRTQEWLGVDRDPERWMGPLVAGDQSSSLYQSANRYAHLFWLREIAGVPAWLVHVLFVDDATHRGATHAEWERALSQIQTDLGMARPVPAAAYVFLPALPAPG